MGEEKGEQKKPHWSPESELIFATPKPEMEEPQKSFRFSKKRCVSFCGGFTVIVVILTLILAFTVYKVRGPLMKVDSITIQNITSTSISANVEVSVKNLNQVAYYFDQTTTSVYHNKTLIGVTSQPAGKAPARRTYKMNVTMEVPAEKLNAIIGGGGLGTDGGVDIDSATIVAGHVNILSVRRHVDVGMNCTVKVSVVNLSILNQSCWQRIWI